MPCALTTGFTLDCKDSIGGVKEIYIIAKGDTTPTVSGNTITTVTNKTGKKFWKYEQIRETSSMTQTYNDNIANGTNYVTQELEIFIPKMLSTVRNEIALLAQNRLWIVVVDRNGKMWWMGYENGVDRNGGTAGTGKAMADANGYTLKFQAMEATEVYEYTGTTTSLTTLGV